MEKNVRIRPEIEVTNWPNNLAYPHIYFFSTGAEYLFRKLRLWNHLHDKSVTLMGLYLTYVG